MMVKRHPYSREVSILWAGIRYWTSRWKPTCSKGGSIAQKEHNAFISSSDVLIKIGQAICAIYKNARPNNNQFKITINVSSYLQENTQYPVDYTYNTCKRLQLFPPPEFEPKWLLNLTLTNDGVSCQISYWTFATKGMAKMWLHGKPVARGCTYIPTRPYLILFKLELCRDNQLFCLPFWVNLFQWEDSW